jgi:hypothetical protein
MCHHAKRSEGGAYHAPARYHDVHMHAIDTSEEEKGSHQSHCKKMRGRGLPERKRGDGQI